METVEQLKAALVALQEAKLAVALGKSATAVGYDGKSVTYKQADLGAINMMIFETKAKLAALGLGHAPRRAFNPVFGR